MQTIVNFKIIKFLKVLMATTRFGQYVHHQMLKYPVGKLLLFIVVLLCVVPQMRMRVVTGVSCSLFFFVVCFVLEAKLPL
jgi:hypothetical protein